jgi:regulatory protein SWI5
MLSNPPSRNQLHLRQRQHRRQNSTPTAIEAVKSEGLPNIHPPRPRPGLSHRRGLSLDTRRQQLSPFAATTTIGQDFTTVSTATTTNTTGPAHPQHVLRESQQQRTARPGLDTPTNFVFPANQTGDTYLLSPRGTPQHQRFQNFAPQETFAISPQFSANHAKTDKANFLTTSTSMGSEDLEFLHTDSALSTPTYTTFDEPFPGTQTQQGWLSEGEIASTRRTSRRISNGIMDRVCKFETMTMEAARPLTPPHQNVPGM